MPQAYHTLGLGYGVVLWSTFVTCLKLIIINIYIAQIPCEYDQMRITNKYDTN